MNDKNVAIILDENWLYEQVKKKKTFFFLIDIIVFGMLVYLIERENWTMKHI